MRSYFQCPDEIQVQGLNTSTPKCCLISSFLSSAETQLCLLLVLHPRIYWTHDSNNFSQNRENRRKILCIGCLCYVSTLTMWAHYFYRRRNQGLQISVAYSRKQNYPMWEAHDLFCSHSRKEEPCLSGCNYLFIICSWRKMSNFLFVLESPAMCKVLAQNKRWIAAYILKIY